MYADLIELDGSLPGEMRNYLGETYSFLEKLRLGGTGSPKCIYLDGNSILDTAAAMNRDSNYCNFELFPNGLVIRLYKINKMAAVAIKKKEIQRIVIQEKSSLSVDYTSNWWLVFRLLQDSIRFSIPQNYHPSFERFFKHQWFEHFQVEREFLV